MPSLKNHLQQAWQEQVKKLSEDFEKNSVAAATSEGGSGESSGKNEGKNEVGIKRKVGETSLPEDETTRKK